VTSPPLRRLFCQFLCGQTRARGREQPARVTRCRGINDLQPGGKISAQIVHSRPDAVGGGQGIGAGGLKALREQLSSLPAPHIHLVLNAAYDTSLLFEQFNWFAPVMPEDLIFTHLDEEQRRVKLWNFVLGTNCSLGWLAGGQKIPGDFHRAESSLLFPHKNLR